MALRIMRRRTYSRRWLPGLTPSAMRKAMPAGVVGDDAHSPVGVFGGTEFYAGVLGDLLKSGAYTSVS